MLHLSAPDLSALPRRRARDQSGNAAATEPSPGAERSGRARWLVAVFGLIALCTAYGEGAMADWAALHLHQDLDASAGLAAAGYAVFALMMAVGRLTGTALLERLAGPGR
ncbi:MFS transporter OS=Streptomyces antimycoticus OX=68175 GN=SANT12839_015270 PE=4 SV=1 [Streptomyces antimycoticus]